MYFRPLFTLHLPLFEWAIKTRIISFHIKLWCKMHDVSCKFIRRDHVATEFEMKFAKIVQKQSLTRTQIIRFTRCSRNGIFFSLIIPLVLCVHTHARAYCTAVERVCIKYRLRIWTQAVKSVCSQILIPNFL